MQVALFHADRRTGGQTWRGLDTIRFANTRKKTLLVLGLH